MAQRAPGHHSWLGGEGVFVLFCFRRRGSEKAASFSQNSLFLHTLEPSGLSSAQVASKGKGLLVTPLHSAGAKGEIPAPRGTGELPSSRRYLLPHLLRGLVQPLHCPLSLYKGPVPPLSRVAGHLMVSCLLPRCPNRLPRPNPTPLGADGFSWNSMCAVESRQSTREGTELASRNAGSRPRHCRLCGFEQSGAFLVVRAPSSEIKGQPPSSSRSVQLLYSTPVLSVLCSRTFRSLPPADKAPAPWASSLQGCASPDPEPPSGPFLMTSPIDTLAQGSQLSYRCPKCSTPTPSVHPLSRHSACRGALPSISTICLLHGALPMLPAPSSQPQLEVSSSSGTLESLGRQFIQPLGVTAWASN